ncbi:hypothetical protein V8F20_009224 [Naviculisporaceae sp. PSN 640]
MADSTSIPADAGGFERPAGLPSPAPSSATTASRSIASSLPKPRAHALRPGSAKEDQVRNFVSDRMLHISRRYVKKFGIAEPDDEVVGYGSFAELCTDLESLINIIWKTGTPSLQIPYLLNIASELNEWVTSFPPSPVETFAVLRKLDHCFASLLAGHDIETKEVLPGFENGLRAGMSRTDMVRCKSTTESTRVLIVDVMSKAHGNTEEQDEPDGDDQLLTADESESAPEGPSHRSRPVWEGETDDDELLQMDVARVYENTLCQLGETLGEKVGEPMQISDD